MVDQVTALIVLQSCLSYLYIPIIPMLAERFSDQHPGTTGRPSSRQRTPGRLWRINIASAMRNVQCAAEVRAPMGSGAQISLGVCSLQVAVPYISQSEFQLFLPLSAPSSSPKYQQHLSSVLRVNSKPTSNCTMQHAATLCLSRHLPGDCQQSRQHPNQLYRMIQGESLPLVYT